MRTLRAVSRRYITQLFALTLFWLRQSAVFAPLAASIQRQKLYFEQGEKLGTSEIEQQMAYYVDLQPKLLYLAEHFFEADRQQDMTERYFKQRETLQDQQSPEQHNYLPLQYGKVTYGPAMAERVHGR